MTEVLETVADLLPAPRANQENKELIEMLIGAFRHGFGELRKEKALKVSNFTCVMKDMGIWNEDSSINMKFYREDIFGDVCLCMDN